MYYKKLPAIIIVITIAWCSCTTPLRFYNIPANVTHGGRSMSIAINPNDEEEIWIGTENGGIFHTIDGGRLWFHLDTLPQFDCRDLKINPAHNNIMIATMKEDGRTRNGGGIWVSNDKGESWHQPPTALPIASDGLPARYSAYGIAFDAIGQKVMVGTDSGFAVSNDLGETWSYINPEPDLSRKGIWSIVILRNRKVVLYGESGILVSDDGMSGWRHTGTTLPDGYDLLHNALAASPINANHVFYGSYWDHMYYSLDAGNTWRTFDLFPSTQAAARQPYIKVVSSLSGNPNELDIYCSQRSKLFKKTIRWTGTDYNFSNDWVAISCAHSDPSDLAFSLENRPYIAVNDGGVEKSIDKGVTWQAIATPLNFFNALQVYNVKGVFYTGTPRRTDLYFGTQDNAFWASPNHGINWPYKTGAEGYGIQGPISYNAGTDSNIIHIEASGNKYYLSNPYYKNQKEIIPPPNRITIPIYVGSKRLICFSSLTPGSDRSVLFISNDEGETWIDSHVIVDQPILNFPQLAGTTGDLSIIAPFKINNDKYQFGLVRIDGALNRVPGDERVNVINMPAGANLGRVPTQFPWYPVFSVDPKNANFMIIPDIVNQNMIKTFDGGTWWILENTLTDLVTDNNKLLFHRRYGRPQVRWVAFDPKNSSNILIGTWQSGIIYSRDHGTSWYKVKDSWKINATTSFFFERQGTAVVSTYGRGLWRVYYPNISTTVLPSTQRIKTKDSLPGDALFWKQVYSDTSGPFLHIQEDTQYNFTGYIEAGKKIELVGTAWPVGHKQDIEILINEKPVKYSLAENQKGRFTIILDPVFVPEHYIVTVKMKTATGKSISKYLEFTVPIQDEEEKPN